MAVNWKWPGWVWLEHTGENAAISAATMALSLMTPGGEMDVPWQTLLIMSGKAAIYAALLAVVALRQQNGTASFLPRVVAQPTPSS
jgi:hypothetical protein